MKRQTILQRGRVGRCAAPRRLWPTGMLVLAFVPSVYATPIYVAPYEGQAGCSQSGPGTLTQPFCDIQTASNYAADTPGIDSVIALPGTYKGGNNRGVTISTFTGAVQCQSVGACTINCEQADRAFFVLREQGTGPLEIDGFIIQNGKTADDGGGMWLSGSISATNLTIMDCEADGSGGGVYVDSPWTTILDSTIERCTANDGGGVYMRTYSSILRSTMRDNTAMRSGGGVYIENCGTINDCDLEDNMADNGGGMAVSTHIGESCSTQIQDSRIVGNTAADAEDHLKGIGGGIQVSSIERPSTYPTVLEILRSTIANNVSRWSGGGIATAHDVRVLIEGSAIMNNRVEDANGVNHDDGGGIGTWWPGDVELRVETTKIVGNVAQRGGAIYLEDAEAGWCWQSGHPCDDGTVGDDPVSRRSVWIYDSLIAENKATDETGGLFLQSMWVFDIVNSTIVFNDGKAPSAISWQLAGNGIASLVNSIVWWNHFHEGHVGQIWQDGNVSGGKLNIRYSNIENGLQSYGWADVNYAASNLENNDPGVDNSPQFACAPFFNGAGHIIEPIGCTGHDYRLEAGSPGIDAGDNGVAGISIMRRDLGGVPRAIDIPTVADTGVWSGGCGIVDMGAYEVQSVPRSRYISINVNMPGVCGARITPQQPLTGFENWTPEARYVGVPFSAPEEDHHNPGATFKAAFLQCDAPTAPAWPQCGVVHVTGAEIVPNSVYDVELLGEDRVTVLEAFEVTTGKWGDVVSPFDGSGGSPQPDFNDIAAVVTKFTAGRDIAESPPIKASAQLQANRPNPMIAVDFRDIAAAVQAFVGGAEGGNGAYPYEGPCDCPASVTCNVTPCTNDLACAGGMCVDGFCGDACGRCAP